MKKIIAIILIHLIFGCASHKKTNELASEIKCDKNFYFAYDKQSDFENFDYNGVHVGNSKLPDFKQTFIESIIDLNKDTEMDLEFVESTIFPSISSVYTKVKIEEIRWNWGFADAVLEVDLEYEMDDEKIHITGRNKVYLGGTKKGNLYKALKNGHYQFIFAICSR